MFRTRDSGFGRTRADSAEGKLAKRTIYSEHFVRDLLRKQRRRNAS